MLAMVWWVPSGLSPGEGVPPLLPGRKYAPFNELGVKRSGKYVITKGLRPNSSF